jgi:hypothetical protein
MYDCANTANNNLVVTDSGYLTITHVGNALQVRAVGAVTNCTLSGPYTQQGSLGGVLNGTYSCTDGARGTFSMVGIQTTLFGMTAGIFGKNQWCSFYGYLGGIGNP